MVTDIGTVGDVSYRTWELSRRTCASPLTQGVAQTSSIDKLKRAIWSINCTHLPSVTLDEMVAKAAWAVDQPLPTEAELQAAVAQSQETPHKIPEECIGKEGLHTGGVTLESIQEYGPLRRLYKDWKLPEDLLSHRTKYSSKYIMH